MSNTVYIAQAEQITLLGVDDAIGLYKIGWTTTAAADRLKSLQTGTPCKLTLRLLMPAITPQAETDLLAATFTMRTRAENEWRALPHNLISAWAESVRAGITADAIGAAMRLTQFGHYDSRDILTKLLNPYAADWPDLYRRALNDLKNRPAPPSPPGEQLALIL